MTIPVCDPSRQYRDLRERIDAAMAQVAARGAYILGPECREFEQEMAAYCGTRFAVGVGNGTDALYLALRAMEIGPGDEVITSPFTFIATTEAIRAVGARPVLVDIDAATFNLNPELIEAAVTPQTKAILPVHLFGQPCDMGAIAEIAQRHNLAILEDCAQALGASYREARVGSIGAAGCLSFFPSKNLGALGDGGMIVTSDQRLYERAEVLRRHGGRVKYHHEEQGVNSRLDELQAAILRIKLTQLEHYNRLRLENACRYNAAFADKAGIVPPHELTAAGPAPLATAEKGGTSLVASVYHQYTVLVEDRDSIMQHLQAAGVASAIYYPLPLHLQPVNTDLGYTAGSLPVAERIARKCLSLPMFPELTTQEISRVIEAVLAAVEDAAPSSRAA